VSALLDAHTQLPAPPLALVAPHVPPPIATVIDRCLAKDRDARYPTGESLADALEKALRLSEPTFSRSSDSSTRRLSPEHVLRILERAAALHRDSLQASKEHPSGATAAYTLRDVEIAAAATGIPQQLVARALSELPTPDEV
jgi:serine/threonine protein kinase